MPEQMDLLIRNARIHTMDRDNRVISRGWLGVKGDRIAVISQGEPEETVSARREIDADGMILFPGFVDTTIVNGKVVYHRGVFAGGLSEADLIREAATEVAEMRKRV